MILDTLSKIFIYGCGSIGKLVMISKITIQSQKFKIQVYRTIKYVERNYF